MKRILICLLGIINFLHAAEFIYPVAALQNGMLLLLYQKSLSHLELWFKYPEHNQIEPGLLSIFTPAGLQVIPDESGFSFIDNGIIRIKYFKKRLPRTLEFDEPISGVNLISWIDPGSFYFSAKYHQYYAIFQMNVEGILDCILKIPGQDCMYPQKIGDAMFYIERERKDLLADEFIDTFFYRIKKTRYPSIRYTEQHNFNYDFDFDGRVQTLLEEKKMKSCIAEDEGEAILECGYPAVFLHMISETEGFVLEHPPYIDNKDETIRFQYHNIFKEGRRWYDREIFSFQIPSKLLLSDSPMRIYESILPLLPKYHEGKIYFVDTKNGTNLDVYLYDFKSKEILQLTNVKDEQFCCVPVVSSRGLHIGGYRIINKIDHNDFGLCIELLDKIVF